MLSRFKPYLGIRCSFLAVSLGLLGSTLSAQEQQPFGRVTFPLGEVQIQVSENPGWTKVNLNQQLFVGDKIRTLEKSRCEITLNGGGKVRLGESTEMELTMAKVTAMKKDFGANVNQGNVWVAARAAFAEQKNVAIQAPTAVAAIRGTKYRAVAREDESSFLVYDGKVDVIWSERLDQDTGDTGEAEPGAMRIGPPQEVAPPEQVPGPYEVSLEDWITLVAGMQINVRTDGRYHMFEFDAEADAELDFVRWNRDLDQQQGE